MKTLRTNRCLDLEAASGENPDINLAHCASRRGLRRLSVMGRVVTASVDGGRAAGAATIRRKEEWLFRSPRAE